MPVYGDMLSVFPELLKEIVLFSMPPKLGSGYGARKREFTCYGWFSRASSNKEKIQGENRAENKSGVLYCFDPLPSGAISQGWYLEDAGELYQIINDNNFSFESGMSTYACQIVTGVTDKQVKNSNVVETAVNDF